MSQPLIAQFASPAAPTSIAVPKRSAVVFEGVHYSVNDRRGRLLEILSAIDLKVAEGEFVAIVGTSGCGKSTLLNLLSGLIKPTRGTIRVLERPVDLVDRRVGYMFQTDALLPWRTVIRNIEIGLEIAGVGKRERRQRAAELMAELGLSGFEQHFPSELSGGMRQRVSMARTWITNPEVLLMDEPFGALDSQTKLVIQDSFMAFWEQHRKTVLFVTHDLQEAIAMADRVIVLSARPGRIKSEYQIDLPRPRSLIAVRTEPVFTEYWRRIWSDLEDEAKLAMRGWSSDGT